MIYQLSTCHIMTKVPKKVGCMLDNCDDFIQWIKGYVWASDSLDEYGQSWWEMLEEF